MAGIGKETGEAAQALKSVEDRLDSRFGIVLLQPAYTKYYLNLGEISSYPPGYKENAGIFCHNNPWITCAEAVLGHGARAFETYRKICPAYLEAVSEVHRTEPYVYSQMVAGKDAPTFGEAKNSWLTGTASAKRRLADRAGRHGAFSRAPDVLPPGLRPGDGIFPPRCGVERLYRLCHDRLLFHLHGAL